MGIYICTISYKVGESQTNTHSKTLYIEADCGIAAWAYCKKISQGWGNRQVFDPEIVKYTAPTPNASVTLKDMQEKYGTELIKEAREATKYQDFRRLDKEESAFEVD